MKRSSNTEKKLRLNTAFELLKLGYTSADAAVALTKKFGLSHRQAYRYLKEAQGIDGPVMVTSPSIPITIKMPEDVVLQLRSHAQNSGIAIGEIVAHAIVSLLDQLHGHG